MRCLKSASEGEKERNKNCAIEIESMGMWQLKRAKAGNSRQHMVKRQNVIASKREIAEINTYKRMSAG